MSKVFSQAISIAAGMPLYFLGQKLWSFRRVGAAAATIAALLGQRLSV